MYLEQKLSLAKCWDLPIPENYFKGQKRYNLPLLDNILFFKRTTRESLCSKNFQSRPHHRFVLICNCGGTGDVVVDTDAYTLQPGQVFLVAPLQFHFYLNLLSDELQWVFMTFETEDQNVFTPMINLPLNMDDRGWRILDRIAGDFRRISQLRKDRYDSPIETNIWMLHCNRFLQRLLVQARSTETPQKKSIYGKEAQHIVSVVNQLLDKEELRKQNIADFAEALHMSTSHLRRRFAEITGSSLGSYVLHYRMNQALKLLVNTTISLTEISLICGYDSLAAFSRSFKKYFGKTPSSYRKEN